MCGTLHWVCSRERTWRPVKCNIGVFTIRLETGCEVIQCKQERVRENVGWPSTFCYSLILAIQTPHDRRRNIPRSSERAMAHTFSVFTYHAPLNWKPVSLFIFRERRVTSSADCSTTRRRQRHAGHGFLRAEDQEGENEDQADGECWATSAFDFSCYTKQD